MSKHGDSRETGGAGPSEDGVATRREGASAPRSLRGAVGSGMIWMMGTTVVGRFASFGAQIGLAWLLTEEDFGIAAMAIAFGAFVQIFRDGGIRRLLIQRGPDEYPRLSGPYFWLSLTFNLGVGALLFALAPVVATRMFNEPQVRDLLWVIALYPPLSSPAAVLIAKLNIDMRFEAIATISGLSAIIRHGGVVIFALLGFGPMSFVLPMPIVAIWEGVAGFVTTRDTPWLRPPRFRIWKPTLKKTGWVMLGTLATSIYNQGDYVLLGTIVATSVVGVYWFAYQLAKQVVVLLMVNLQTVLLPTLSRLQGEPARQRAAAMNTIRLLTLVSTPLAFGLMVTIDPLEQLLWDGRWANAVAPIQVLSLALPLMILNTVPRAVLMSIGQFRSWSLIILADGLGMVTAATIGGLLTRDQANIQFFAGEARDPLGIAACVAAYTTVSSILYSWVGLRPISTRLRSLVRSFSPPLLIGLAAAAIAMTLDRMLPPQTPAFLRLLLSGMVFSAIYVLAIRRILAPDLRSLISTLPGPLRAPLATALRVREGDAPPPRPQALGDEPPIDL